MPVNIGEPPENSHLPAMTIYVATTEEGVALQKRYRRYRAKIERARTRIRRGFGLSVFISIANLLLGIFIFSYAPADRQQLGMFLLINVIVFFCLGLGILINNRFCAISIVAYLVIQSLVLIWLGFVPFPFLLFALAFALAFCQTIAAIVDYGKLTNKEQFFQAHLAGMRKLEVSVVGNIDLLDLKVEDSNPPTPAVKTPASPDRIIAGSIGASLEREQLIPCQDLIQLCNGDRNQATWLLSQIRAKDPHRSLEYYNAMAIGQIRDEISGMLDKNR
jgi:hypothetical protein